ncbi:unnamed protein product [Candidula unifasciata]|uniref:RING-type E3 ubiquitin transferase n=1 Tax=Candidula unifasciata TaxID=100452 RepID=A0A8S4A4P8_9EUPU|nr:unnamed protein product [Candidula unifasciata]
MEGYDCDFIIPPEPRYECPICLLVLREPHQTKCGHRFCKDCIITSLRDSSNRCPIDNESLSESDVYPDNFAKREILNFSIRCPNFKSGCDKIIPLGKLQNHLEECYFALVPCPLKCSREVPRCDLDSHLNNSCENRNVTCEHCSKNMEAKDFEVHVEVCPMAIVVCSHCEERAVRNKMEHHIYNECQQVMVHCPFYFLGCSKVMMRCMVDDHLIMSAPSHLKQLCFAVTFLAQKLGTANSVCQTSAKNTHQKVSLVQRFNAESAVTLPVSYKSSHSLEEVSTNEMSFNFEAALAELSALSLENEEAKGAEHSYKLSSITKQLPLGCLPNGHHGIKQPVYRPHDWLNYCTAEEQETSGLPLLSQILSTKPTVCKLYQSKLSPQISAAVNHSPEFANLLLGDQGLGEYIPENSDVKSMFQEITSRFKKREAASEQKFDELHRRLTAVEQTNSGLINTVRDLEQHVVEASGRFVNGDFCWCIHNFSHYRLKLEAGENSMLHSPPFYTSPWGYKMCIRASIDSASQNERHLSLFVHFMKGKNDAFLMWPFSGRINISVVDQNPDASRRNHIMEVLETNPNLDAFQRPTIPRNHKGFGYVQFVSISALENGSYLMDDVLVIRTQVYSQYQ